MSRCSRASQAADTCFYEAESKFERSAGLGKQELCMEVSSTRPPKHELKFRPLSGRGSACAFPCNVLGQVDLDALDERARNNYLFARISVGRIFHSPTIEPVRQMSLPLL
jgi:hypothetical protein